MMLSSIQALRFMAALLVLFFHLAILHSGYKGVDIFFVISGFVLYHNYHSSLHSVRRSKRKYFINRFTKIYLLYWTALAASYLIVPFPLNYSTWTTLLLLPGHYSVLTVSWSLSYELYFYVLFGIVLFYIPHRRQPALFWCAFLLTSAITILDATSFSLQGDIVNFLMGHNLWEFLLGVLAGRLYNAGSVRIHRSPLVYPVLSLLLLIGITLVDIRYKAPYGYIIYGSLAFFLIITATQWEREEPKHFLLKNAIITLGNASYAMYLFSPLIIGMTRPSGWLPTLLVILLTITISILVNTFYEVHALRILRRLLLKFT
jgi:exopolysaccharide production protein ExoZ